MRSLLALPLLLAALPAFAQRTDDQLWLQASGTVPVTAHSEATIENIVRFGDRAKGLAHTEIGGLYAWKIGKIEIGIGYRHVEDFSDGRALPNEERTRQHIIVPLAAGLAARIRVEQRFNSSGSGIGHRVRGQLRFTHALTRGGFGLFAAHETFLNLNTTGWGQREGVERMRNSIGLGVPVSRQLRLETGYLNQYRFGRNGARDQMDHAVTLSLTLRA
ncbi:DUF2490 domain-containing protein [Sphingomonas sp. HITSZ_GF]|uniref:DUF2490 domain-containing protein n=1 Tax=Sphingomonas sp. HITSZ_GF TaxID=3037247 RepID=UPI00240DEDC8|nr:DUF2490 domain-containing protein [Sphingomonas sp. HITSZ_GF]MDG2534781.1 DUF2490 domain-containing protein [Sphingomonas sp. HITSZ_GF]